MSTKLATHTPIRSPLNGFTASMPSGTPFFSTVSTSASRNPPWRHSSTKAATFGSAAARRSASG